MVFVRDHGLTDKREIRVETAGGLIVPRLESDGQVTVDMGVPRFRPEEIPFTGGEGAIEETLDVAGALVRISALSMGNPHGVQIVNDVDAHHATHAGIAVDFDLAHPAHRRPKDGGNLHRCIAGP